MSRPPYRALRIVLGIFSFLAAAGGLLLIFSSKPLMLRLFLRPPESELSTLLLSMMKEMGGFVLMLSVLLFFAYREPARNVPSHDGTLVPLSIIYPKGMKLDGSHPTWLSGYGGYGITMNPFFDPKTLAWYERGGVRATCHVRGGGEYGEEWHLNVKEETSGAPGGTRTPGLVDGY